MLVGSTVDSDRGERRTRQRSSVDDIQVGSAPQLGRSRSEDGAHRLRGTPLLTDDLSNVPLGHSQLDQGVLITFDFSHFDAIRVVDESLSYGGDKFLQRHANRF